MRINEEIQAHDVILIDESGKSYGKVSYDQAMLLAYEKGIDVVMVNANAYPPVVKLMDYTKEIYKIEKAKRKQRAKQKNTELKEIKLGIKIEEHDLETKSNQAKKFLEKGHKVRLTLILRGREMLFQDKVKNLFDKFSHISNAVYEEPLKREGNRFKATITAKK